MKEPLLDTLERKLRKITIRNLMLFIVIGSVIVWLLDYIVSYRTGVYVSRYLYFNKTLILQGEVWRAITFIFVPMDSRPLFFALSLYFYWLIGTGLENAWGSFRFDAFYFIGVVGNIVFGFITGFATAEYLHLSMFIAYAIINPDDRVLLFFFIPIKMKWLAIVDAVLLIALFVMGNWQIKVALAVAFVNLAIFFIKDVVWKIRAGSRRRQWKKQIQRKDDDDPFEL